MTTSTQDSGQSPRIGQRAPAEGGSKIELIDDVLSLPEAPWPGRMVYNLELAVFQIYSGNVGGWITANDAAGNVTFVQDTEPVATAVGDWWVDTNGPGVEDNQLFVWNGIDWILYVDPTGASKIKSFYQDTTPTATTLGDLWFDTNDDNRQWRWNGATWDSTRDGTIATAQSTADGKNTVFRATSAPSANKAGDLWFDTDDGNKPYVSTAAGSGSWVAAQDGDIAVAQAAADAAQAAADAAATDASTAIAAAATAQATADGKVTTWFQNTQPATPTAAIGDVWYNTDDGSAATLTSIGATDDLDVWDPIQDARLIAALQAAQDAQSTADGKITTFFGSADEIAAEEPSLGDLWYNTDEDNARYRWGLDLDGQLGWLTLSTPTVPEKIVAGVINVALTFAAANTLQNNIPAPKVPSIVQGHATGQNFPLTPDGYSARGIAWDSDNSRWIQLLERTDPLSPNTGAPFIRTISTGGSAGSPTLCDTNGIDSKGVRWGITYYDNGGSGSARYIYCVSDTGPQTQQIFKIRVDSGNFGNYSDDKALAVGDAVVLFGDTAGNQYVINEAAFASTGNKKITRYTSGFGSTAYAYVNCPSSTYFASYLRGGGVGDYGYGSSKITLLGSSSGDWHLVFDLPNFTTHTTSSINTTYSYAHNTSCSGGAWFKTTTGEIYSRDGAATTLAKWSTFFPGTNKYWSVCYADGINGALATQHSKASDYASVAVTPRNYFSVSLPTAPTGITAARVWAKYGTTKQSGAPSSNHYQAGDITGRTLSLGSAEGTPVNKAPGAGSTDVWNAALGLPDSYGSIVSEAGGLLLRGDGLLEATAPVFSTYPRYTTDVVSSNTVVNSTSDTTLMSVGVLVKKTTSYFLVLVMGQGTIGANDDTLTGTLRVDGNDQSDLIQLRGRANDRLPIHGVWFIKAADFGWAAGSTKTFLAKFKVGGAGNSVTVDANTTMHILGF